MIRTRTDLSPPWSYIWERQVHSRTLLETAATIYGASIVDPLPFFCSDAHCDAMRDGVALYKDADHTTETKAQRLSYFYTSIHITGIRRPNPVQLTGHRTVSPGKGILDMKGDRGGSLPDPSRVVVCKVELSTCFRKRRDGL